LTLLLSAAAVLAFAATMPFILMRGRLSPAVLEASIANPQGQAWVARGELREPARPGMNLLESDRLRTGPGGGMELKYKDGTTILLFAETDARFASRRADLKIGAIRCDVAPQFADKPFVFATPHAEATVLGTTFELTAARDETRLHTLRGRVRLTSGGSSTEVSSGGLATADEQGLCVWESVCDLDFSAMKALPPRMETVYCASDELPKPDRRIVPAPRSALLGNGGLRLAGEAGMMPGHGLVVLRWTEDIGEDAVVETMVAGGEAWSLGLAVSGDSFRGYRIIFATPGPPGGIGVDTLHPSDHTLLAQDPRPIAFDRDHTLRAEKRGKRIRVWLDREPRIDTEITYPLPANRLKTFAISNFGASPLIRSLRVWKNAVR